MESDQAKRPFVMITGSSRGLGLELAKAFAEKGYNLIMHGSAPERLKYAQAAVSELYSQPIIKAVCGNLREPITIEYLAKAAHENSFLILINNAAEYVCANLEEMENALILDVLAVNLIAPIALSRELLPKLRKTAGVIVNINSLAAHSPARLETIYAASKAGLEGFSKAFKFEAAPVRILDIFLGGMATEMTAGRPDQDSLCDPAEVAHTILASVQALILNRSCRLDSIDIRRTRYK